MIFRMISPMDAPGIPGAPGTPASPISNTQTV